MAKRRKSEPPKRTLPWGFGRTPTRRGNSWEARWWEDQPDGTRIERSQAFPITPGGEQQAFDAAIDHLTTIGRQKRDGQYVEPADRTVEHIVREWLKRGKRRWQPSTWATYHQLAEKHVLPHLGTFPARTLTTPRIQHWIDTLADSGLSPAYIDNARLIITGSYKQAVRGGVLRDNPTIGIEVPPRQRSAVTTWTAAEAQRMIATVATDPMWHALYRLALTTGMRPGELRALKWSDVDTGNGIVTVRRTMTRDDGYHPVIGERTKTDDVRGVALTAETSAALTAWRTEQKRRRLAARIWHEHDLVFTRADGRFVAQTSWATRHRAFCELAGVPRITLHSLRHTVATLMLENNVHPKIVSDLLGHGSIEMTLNRYSHVSVSLQRQSVDALEAVLETAKQAKTP